jgi:hypothetical protein
MKAPWKYRVVSAREYSKRMRQFKEKAMYHKRPSAFFGHCLGSNWYRKGMEIAWDVFNKVVHHWTREVPCCHLQPGYSIVDCLAGVRNKRGRLFWVVGQHYVGMCPFKGKWRYKLILKSWVGKNGRTN